MKIRIGFVSNSSASSFMIYGVRLESFDLVDAIKKMQEEVIKPIIEKMADDYELTDRDSKDWKEAIDLLMEDDEAEFIYDVMEKLNTGLDVHNMYDYDPDHIYIGLSPESIGGDETGNEFKARVKSAIKGLIGKEIECQFIEEAWR